MKMSKTTYSLIILSIIMPAIKADIPGCDFFDTVDLQGSDRFENGSYLYKDVLIPSDKIGIFDYRITVYGAVIQAASYPRGCLCQVKSCLLFCCEPDNMSFNNDLNVTLSNDTEVQLNLSSLLKEFVVQVKFNIPCNLLAKNGTVEQTYGEWKLFENGTLLSLTESSSQNKKDYCLIPKMVSQDDYELVPHNFLPTQMEPGTKKSLDQDSAIRIISVCCMLIAIAVYLYLPQFHTIYGKCCLWYFICLTISFLLLCAESQYRDEQHSIKACYAMGYFGYYAVMTVFLWLLVINYHLWKTFKSYGIMGKTSMLRYHIFVWSTAAVLLTITTSVEYTLQVNNISEEWQPGISIYSCWINTVGFSAMIYYYGPILVGILINLTLSVITARHIYVENRENGRDWNSSESQKNFKNRAEFGMFFRLFAIAGVIWLLEIFSYWLQIKIETITLLFDIITSGQGILLFFVTIWKKDVLKSLYERLEARGN